ncbi:MAG TPA: flagellar hook capping FlgD N-terminal domain-containing protein, partial [Pseudolabrys sp.]
MSAITSTPLTAAQSAAAAASSSSDNTMIASNFTTFLQLLTTQLQNQ